MLILEQLQRDHNQNLRILFNLRREVQAYAGLASSRGRIERILEMLDYLKVYPQLWHHPVEEGLYRALLKKPLSEQQRVLVEKRLLELDTLNLLPEQLHELFSAEAIAEPMNKRVPFQRILKLCLNYCDRQFTHIQLEQEEVFSLFAELLSALDWQNALIVSRHCGRSDTGCELADRQEYIALGQRVNESHLLTATATAPLQAVVSGAF